MKPSFCRFGYFQKVKHPAKDLAKFSLSTLKMKMRIIVCFKSSILFKTAQIDIKYHTC